MQEPSKPDRTSTRRRGLVWIIRAIILALVCFGVSGTVRRALAQLSQHEWHVEPAWLVVSGVLYALGLVPMAWFWYRALASLGQPAPWSASLRAYFFGHLGKYVPGKALAVIMRVAAVRRWVASIRIALISSLLETLTMMAVGAALAAVLAIFVLRLDWTVSLLALGMAAALGLPTLPPVARWLARIGASRFKQKAASEMVASSGARAATADSEVSLRGLNWILFIDGWMAASACWVLLGISLWSILRALGIEALDPFADLPLLIASVAFAVVAGFASMLPGGLVVRDALVMQLLTSTCGAANALVAAVLMRLVWLVSELVVCVILYVAAKLRPNTDSSTNTDRS